MKKSELLTFAKQLQIMAEAIGRKEIELLNWERKLEDREATLRISYLEIKNLNGSTKC